MNKKKNKTRPNPNSTFITTHINEKKVIAYIDTGATLCFGKRTILTNWERLKTPVKITIADKSMHKIWWVGRNIKIHLNIQKMPQITLSKKKRSHD